MSTQFLTTCTTCGGKTSRSFARKNGGRCKSCVTGQPQPRAETHATRNARILDAGWQAYATEEGHYDDGGDQ